MTPELITYAVIMAIALLLAVVLMVIGFRRQLLLHGWGSRVGREARPWLIAGSAIIAALLLFSAGSALGVRLGANF